MKKKVLLMGKSGSGKTSMRSVIFSNERAIVTGKFGATIDVEQNHVRFLGSLVLNLWDCGGQDSFMDSYLSNQRSTIFAHVGVLIYVFDVESREMEKELGYYRECLQALSKYSPESGVFVLVHKMDLVQPRDRQETFDRKRRELLAASGDTKVRMFGTSIWDESLYKAWSRIVHTLIPNGPILTKHLTTLAKACGAIEVVLFERQTFLLIARSGEGSDPSDDLLVSPTPSPNANTSQATGFDFPPHSPTSSLSSPTITGSLSFHNDLNPTLPSNTGSNFASNPTGPTTTATSTASLPANRFEKTSSLIKAFRHNASSRGEGFHSFEMCLPNYTAVLDVLTANSYVLVVAADPRIQPSAIKINIRLARKKFEELQAGFVA